MLTLPDILDALRLQAQVGEIGLPIPRDHLPESYYIERALEESRSYEENNAPKDKK